MTMRAAIAWALLALSMPCGAWAQATSAQPKGRLFPPIDLGLLEMPDREQWTRPDVIMDALGIADGATVADFGAGGGWFTSQLARRVGPNGVVYAQDIQPLMIEAITSRVQNEGLTNVRTVMGTSNDPRLPSGLDAILIVDAYHEMNDPSRPDFIVTLLRTLAVSLKPLGRLGIVDYLPGGGGPGPDANERIDPDEVVRAAEAAGLRLQSRQDIPPFQFLLVFGRTTPPVVERAAAPAKTGTQVR
jgi:predicted methyltransferase